MKTKRNITLRLLALGLLLPALWGGCTQEDLAVCGVDLLFEFTPDSSQPSRFPSDIEWVDIYVFDRDGLFVGVFPQQGPFDENFRARLVLPAGTYDFIVWGEYNGEHYRLSELIPGTSRLSEAELNLILANEAGRVEGFPADIYHGARIQTSIQALGSEVLIPMIKNTNKIQTRFLGLPVSRSTAEGFVCRIESENGDYTFENNLTGSRGLNYIPVVTRNFEEEEEPTLTYDFVTMRLIGEDTRTRAPGESRPCNSRLILEYRSDSQVLEIMNVSLIEAIRAEYGESVDLDGRDEFALQFNYSGDYAFGNYTITVNGWTVTEVNNGSGGWIW